MNDILPQNAATQQADLEPKRGPGRPPKAISAETPEAPVKKGKKSWTPSNLGDVQNKEAGFRYRWARKDDDNLAKKREEGWEFVSGVNGTKTKGTHPDSRPDEPHQMTSNIERRDGVLMRLDDETSEARDDYMNGKTARTMSALKKQTQDDVGKSGALLHGGINIQKRGIPVIKD